MAEFMSTSEISRNPGLFHSAGTSLVADDIGGNPEIYGWPFPTWSMYRGVTSIEEPIDTIDWLLGFCQKDIVAVMGEFPKTKKI